LLGQTGQPSQFLTADDRPPRQRCQDGELLVTEGQRFTVEQRLPLHDVEKEARVIRRERVHPRDRMNHVFRTGSRIVNSR
jgi:hypothetical protein